MAMSVEMSDLVRVFRSGERQGRVLFKLSGEMLSQEDTVIAVLHGAGYFVKSKMTVEAEIFCHQLIGVEVDHTQIFAPGLLFGERHERAAQSLSLKCRGHRDILDEQAFILPHHHQHPTQVILLHQHKDDTLFDKRRIVSEHGRWLLANTLDIDGIGGLHTLHNGRAVSLNGLPDDLLMADITSG